MFRAKNFYLIPLLLPRALRSAEAHLLKLEQNGQAVRQARAMTCKLPQM